MGFSAVFLLLVSIPNVGYTRFRLWYNMDKSM